MQLATPSDVVKIPIRIFGNQLMPLLMALAGEISVQSFFSPLDHI